MMTTVEFLYHKLSSAVVSRRHESQRHSDNVLRQIEGMFAVEGALRGTVPLPRSRGWAASPDFLHAPLLLAEQHRPGCIVECSSGYSTLVLAAHCRRTGSGKVVSLENEMGCAVLVRES